jgi:hypothetical protein
MFVPMPTVEIPADKGKAPAQGGSRGGNGGPPTAANTTVMAPVERPNRGSLRGNPVKVRQDLVLDMSKSGSAKA